MNPRYEVWTVPLSAPLPRSALAIVSPEERERAARFVVPADAHAHLALRAGARQALAARLGAHDPAAIRFRLSPAGKPLLEGFGDVQIDFSIAHTRAWGVLAIAEGARVGVDVEPARRSLDELSGVADLLSAAERVSLPPEEDDARRASLLRAWLGREAFVKASGRGLGGVDLRQVIIPRAGETPSRLVVPAELECEAGWWLQEFIVGMDHRAALVTEGRAEPVSPRAWEWR